MSGIFDFVGNDDISIDFYDDAYFSSSTVNLDYNLVSTNVINNTYITNTVDMEMFLEDIDSILEAVMEGMWWYFF